MKKPVNKFAVALWIVAVIVFAGGVNSLLAMHEMARDMSRIAARDGGTLSEVLGGSWMMTIGSLLPAAQLAAFGVLIELVDQIRWTLLHKSD